MIVPAGEFFDNSTGEFSYTYESELVLEHSLAAIARWESKWKKPFLESGGLLKNQKETKTVDEFFDYIRCMTINEPADKNCYRSLTQAQLQVIAAYLQDPATATTFSDVATKKFASQKITAEIVYHWMVSLNIPFICDQWNFNRLLALIRVCSIKSQKPKNRPKKEVIEQRKQLNAQRRQQFNTRG